MVEKEQTLQISMILRRRPDAWAEIAGSSEHPQIHGVVRFYQTRSGVIVSAQVNGLPHGEEQCEKQFFGFHIHSGTQCSGNEADPFADALTHYNPLDCPHPAHAGDFPPLLGNHGLAVLLFLTDRFTVREVLGKTVIIHMHPDDFTSQPAGDAGTKIACGVIKSTGFHR